jgi:hypothetical protein
MTMAVYDPRWLLAETPQGACAPSPSPSQRKSPSHTGELSEEEYCRSFRRPRASTARRWTTRTARWRNCAGTTSATATWKSCCG